MNAAAILRKAADLIEQRAAQRDRPDGEKSMAATVNAFNAIYGTKLTEVQGWHFMELLKMVRSAYGIYVPDDFEDKVAYAALAAESAVPAPEQMVLGLDLAPEQAASTERQERRLDEAAYAALAAEVKKPVFSDPAVWAPKGNPKYGPHCEGCTAAGCSGCEHAGR